MAAAAERVPPVFLEHEPHEKGFARVFAREIAPRLDELEQKRVHRRKQAKWGHAALLTGLIFLVAFLSYVVFLFAVGDPLARDGFFDFVLTLVVFVLVELCFTSLGLYLELSARKEHHRDLQDLIVGPVGRFLGDLEHVSNPLKRFDLHRFRGLGVIPPHQAAHLDAMFVGRHGPTLFSTAEAHLYQGRRRLAFKGRLYVIGVPRSFSAHVIVEGDPAPGGVAPQARTRLHGLDRVSAGRSRAAVGFRIYSDDPAEARALATGEVLREVEHLADGDDVSPRAVFSHGTLYLAVPKGGSPFDPDLLGRSARDYGRDVRALLRDLTAPRRLIELLSR